jgi:hypothetical protein
MDHQNKKVDPQYQKIDHACRYALAFRALADESKSIQLLTRYEAAHERSFYRALTTLLKLRVEPKSSPDALQPPAHPDPEPVPPKPNQEVSQTEPAGKSFCETNPTDDERPAADATTTTENSPLTDQNPKISGPLANPGGPQ